MSLKKTQNKTKKSWYIRIIFKTNDVLVPQHLSKTQVIFKENIMGSFVYLEESVHCFLKCCCWWAGKQGGSNTTFKPAQTVHLQNGKTVISDLLLIYWRNDEVIDARIVGFFLRWKSYEKIKAEKMTPPPPPFSTDTHTQKFGLNCEEQHVQYCLSWENLYKVRFSCEKI